MADNSELFEQIALADSGAVERTFESDGKSVTLHIARWSDIGDVIGWQRACQNREKALKAQKGKFAVTLPAELAEKYGARLKDTTPLDGGKLEAYCNSVEELFMATTLEHGVVDPETQKRRFSWPEAVLFVKLNWKIASKVLDALNKLNDLEAKEAAKKGSTKPDTEDSGDS